MLGSSMTSHFMDKVIERLVASTVDELLVERRDIERRLHDPDRKRQPGLSVRVIASNFRQILKLLGPVFRVQYGFVHILLWRRPLKTLVFVALYTALCLHPHLIFVYPLLTLLVAVSIPAYYFRHPMGTPTLIKVNKRGLSLFHYLLKPDDNDLLILEDKLEEMEEEKEEELDQAPEKPDQKKRFRWRRDKPQLNLDNPELQDQGEEEDVPTSKEVFAHPQLALAGDSDNSRIAKGVGLMMNMRDFQNLTLDVVYMLQKANSTWQDGFQFQDEKLLTLVFYGLMVATAFTLFFGQFIPWRLIFIGGGWGVFAICHPSAKKFIEKQKAAKKKTQAKIPPKELPTTGEPVDRLAYTRELLIVDDAPEIRHVEIWELQSKLALEQEWKANCYTDTLFDRKHPLRLKGKRPVGVDTLAKTHPPAGWKFDFGLANKWITDYEPMVTLREREWDTLGFSGADADGWVYDTPPSLTSGEIEIEFRRRRLYRECFRYARPINT